MLDQPNAGSSLGDIAAIGARLGEHAADIERAASPLGFRADRIVRTDQAAVAGERNGGQIEALQSRSADLPFHVMNRANRADRTRA